MTRNSTDDFIRDPPFLDTSLLLGDGPDLPIENRGNTVEAAAVTATWDKKVLRFIFVFVILFSLFLNSM